MTRKVWLAIRVAIPAAKARRRNNDVGVGLRKRFHDEHRPAQVDRAEQRLLGILGQVAAVDVDVVIIPYGVVAGHLVALAAPLVQRRPQPSILDIHVLDLYPE